MYEKQKGIFDGEFETFKTCLDCKSLRANFFTSYYFGYVWSDWRDSMEDCWYQIPESKLAALTPAARARCCDAIEDWWINHPDDEEES